jgi:16S rRNA (uracil1498-N3)-methyltransferase
LPEDVGGGILAWMSERFYLNWPLEPGAVTLQGAEAHHLAAVCRLRPGDALYLFNGDGHEYPARVLTVQRRSVEVEILGRETPARELPFCLEVAAPLPKGDRAQFLVEKLTELGVTTFVPLSTQRSIVNPREAKLEKLRRYVIEASKQCRRNRLMEVGELIDWASYVQRGDLPPRRYLAHPGGAIKAGKLRASRDGTSAIVIAVGPEGGFSDEEVDVARATDWVAVDLGPRILRVETAAISLAASIVFEQGAVDEGG